MIENNDKIKIRNIDDGQQTLRGRAFGFLHKNVQLVIKL